MAGPSTSASRMGIQLQQYDQVIALSQANINETLEYHFTANPELCKFDVETGVSSLSGTIKPPTIQLVDVQNADQALYCLEFESGNYSYWYIPAETSGENGVKKKNKRQPIEATTSVKGWRLAFYVDFSLKRMGQVPPKIAAKIQVPGSYSVNQLLINFGTADLMNFDWGSSKFTGLDQAGETAARGSIATFIAEWLQGLKAKDSEESHNVLGSAVKIEVPQDKSLKEVLDQIPNSTPSFPPTLVRLQTINHRPGGDINRASTDNDHNAFLFTEMTEGRPFPGKDLEWTGDWFYESFGGTLAMSRNIFWDRFITQKMRIANQRVLNGAAEIAKIMSMNLLPGDWWLLSKERPAIEGKWTGQSGLAATFSFDGPKYRSYFEKEEEGPNPQYEFDVSTSIQNTLTPFPGEGRIELRTNISMQGVLGAELSFLPGQSEVKTWVKVSSTTYINFKSVENNTNLVVKVEKGDTEISTKAQVGSDSVFAKIPGVGKLYVEMIRKLMDANTFEQMVNGALTKFATSAVDAQPQLEAALNGQNRFIFPGKDEFAMKDPIFNRAGDLMIGLTYRNGGAAKP